MTDNLRFPPAIQERIDRVKAQARARGDNRTESEVFRDSVRMLIQLDILGIPPEETP